MPLLGGIKLTKLEMASYKLVGYLNDVQSLTT